MKKALQILITLLLGLSLPLLPAFAGPDDSDREGGILGTGIVGTITHLGSIIVNGQRITYETDMPVVDGVSVSRAEALLPGHTVAVIAHPDGDNWRAAHIRQILPLVGPLQISDDGRFSVMGTNIVTDGALFAAVPGDWVAVSGLWQEGQVIATRIDRVSPETSARIEGSALDFTGDRVLRIGGTEILGLLPRHIRDGDVVRAFGSPETTGLLVVRLETGVFDSKPGVVLAEGYMSPPSPSGLYTVLGTNFVSFTDNPAMIDPAVRFFACGQDGTMSAAVRVSDDLTDHVPFLSDCLNPAAKLSPGQSD